jgi:ribosomal protein L16 Arg81 hydroxylase
MASNIPREVESASGGRDASGLTLPTEWRRLAIRRVRDPEPSDFRRNHFERKPILLTHIANDWPALRRWTRSGLREMVGDVKVRFILSKKNALSSPEIVDTLASYFDRLGEFDAEARRRVVIGCDISQLRSLKDDFQPPRFLEQVLRAPMAIHFWSAPGGYTTNLHHDQTHNLVAQVTGRKHAVFFPPSDWRSFYPVPVFSGPAGMARVDVENPDYTKFPLLRRVRVAYECTLDPGDILYIPAGWWHTVKSMEPFNVSLHWRWAPRVLKFFTDSRLIRLEVSRYYRMMTDFLRSAGKRAHQ